MTSPLSDPPAPASDRTQRMDLVMEGGGVKGVALAGALEVLEERGYRVNRAAGSSAGSIAAALATAGIPAATIVEILRETDYRRFEDGPWWTRPLIGKGLSILLHNGIHRGRYLTAWLEEQLASHGAPGRTGTFADLLYRDPEDTTAPSQPMAPVGTPATQTPATSSPTAQTPTPRSPGTQIPTTAQPQPHRYRLVVTASDLTSGRLRFLPTDADAFGAAPGQLRVVDAVRASTSIPFFFRPVKWKNAYGKPAWLVDGGLLSNFPVSVFDRPADEVPRWPTFGIKLSARPETDFGVENRISGPLSFGKAVVDTVTGFYDRMHIEASHAVARTIFIDTDAVRPSQFDLSDAEREQLYTKGRQAATDFLDGTDDQDAWDFDRYRERFRTGPSAR